MKIHFAVLLCVLGASSADLRCDTSEAERANITHAALEQMKGMGYKVTEGHFGVFNSSGFGANPGNPYSVYSFHSIGRESIPVFRLGTQDAILLVSCTPPQTRYFAWRSYAMTQGLHLVFASLGDTLNNLVVNTTATDRESNFEKTLAVITTADHDTLSDVRNALSSAGLDERATNLDAIPSERLSMRLDTFTMLHRASVWKSEADKAAYFHQPPRKIYYLQAPSHKKAAPLAPIALRRRGTGHAEQAINGVLDGVAQLNEGLVAVLAELPAYLVNTSTMTNYPLDGFQCLKEDKDCLGDNRDTNYIKSDPITLDDDDLIAVFGTDSVATGKCTYTNLGVYATTSVSHGGVKAKSSNVSADFRKFPGSAQPYAPQAPAGNLLFVQFFARNCSAMSGVPAQHCTSVPDNAVPRDQKFFLVYRTYLEPATKTGPLVSELVLPTALHFRRGHAQQ